MSHKWSDQITGPVRLFRQNSLQLDGFVSMNNSLGHESTPSLPISLAPVAFVATALLAGRFGTRSDCGCARTTAGSSWSLDTATTAYLRIRDS